MTAAEIRQSFLDFFREKQHTIVPSSSLLPDSPNLLFTNAGMNQFVPIFLGQQKPAWNPPRVVDTQKCIRAGGKHNDLEDVGLDTYHHTFFEMLGNWSFGDYFKKEAIEWAWELVVNRWGLPAQRLYATVYKPGPGEPSEFDQEAHDHWARLFQDADLDPAIHVVNGGKADNFWMMGETGPCGPCSELHVDLTPLGDTRGALVNQDDPRCIEIWNLVFIQFNAQPVAGVADPGRMEFVPLPQRHVDTGLGLERSTALIQGTKSFTDFSDAISNYETDVFRPIFDELEKLSGKTYSSTLPKRGSAGENEHEKIDIAFRVLADHIRTLSFAIADGIIPSNEGRGYVLRRILRRAVRYGRALDFHEPFFFKLVDVVAKEMGEVFPLVRTKQGAVKETIRREEESFNRTLDIGLRFFEVAEALRVAVHRQSRIIAGPEHVEDVADRVLRDEAIQEIARLSRLAGDTMKRAFSADERVLITLAEKQHRQNEALPKYGYPPSVVKALDHADTARAIQAAKRIISTPETVSGFVAFVLYDTYGFPVDLTQLMAREHGVTVDVAGFEKLMDQQRARARAAQTKEKIAVASVENLLGPTKFVGYCQFAVTKTKYAVRGDQLFLERSPFYAEMGGQVGDTGYVETRAGRRVSVINTVKTPDGVFVHKLAQPEALNEPDDPPTRFVVDKERRLAIQRHHTATHILHWALHEVVNRDAVQKGSRVSPDKLTFDFASSPLTPNQKGAVEKLVNNRVAEDATVSSRLLLYARARERSDIQQFFADKYGDRVRVVQIGGSPRALNGYSMELCGGTHVSSTSEIGAFRIVKEEAISAGIRRIEAVAGEAARDWAKMEAAKQQEKFEALTKRKSDIAVLPVFSREADATEMLKQIDVRAAHLEKVDVDLREWEKKNAKSAEADLRKRAATIANDLAGEKFLVANVADADSKLLQAIVDLVRARFKGPIFLAGASGGRVALIASVPKDLAAKFQANKLIQEIAPLVGGKGGGRPEMAQGSGNDASKIDSALTKARELLA